MNIENQPSPEKLNPFLVQVRTMLRKTDNSLKYLENSIDSNENSTSILCIPIKELNKVYDQKNVSKYIISKESKNLKEQNYNSYKSNISDYKTTFTNQNNKLTNSTNIANKIPHQETINNSLKRSSYGDSDLQEIEAEMNNLKKPKLSNFCNVIAKNKRVVSIANKFGTTVTRKIPSSFRSRIVEKFEQTPPLTTTQMVGNSFIKFGEHGREIYKEENVKPNDFLAMAKANLKRVPPPPPPPVSVDVLEDESIIINEQNSPSQASQEALKTIDTLNLQMEKIQKSITYIPTPIKVNHQTNNLEEIKSLLLKPMYPSLVSIGLQTETTTFSPIMVVTPEIKAFEEKSDKVTTLNENYITDQSISSTPIRPVSEMKRLWDRWK